jgi:hypothetical protein
MNGYVSWGAAIFLISIILFLVAGTIERIYPDLYIIVEAPAFCTLGLACLLMAMGSFVESDKD